MPQGPLVTVLMTVYNGLPYLPEAVESVLRQTVEDLELLVIDDASTDGSIECVRRFSDPRIRLVCNERNLGQARSLNRGLELARAPYVARLDQDDVCLPDRLQRQVTFLEQRPDVAVVGTWVYYVSPAGRKMSVVGMRIDDRGAFLGALLTYATPFGHPTVMFRRDLVRGLGGYDPSFAPCEDYALWSRLALQRDRALTIPHPLLMLRLHDRQQSQLALAAQQAQCRRAHDALVSAFCHAEEAPLIGSLLRMEDSLWTACRSHGQIRAALGRLDGVLMRLRQALGLSDQESASLTHRVRWWLGHGAFTGILQQHRQSVAVFGYALRDGVRMARYPAILCYPGCFLLSPLFVPSLRRFCRGWMANLGRVKYVMRLVVDELRHRFVSDKQSADADFFNRTQGKTEMLYISYDGMLEPLGQSQVISYLGPIATSYAVTLLSYEKRQDLNNRERLRDMSDDLRAQGIRWRWLTYHKRPSLLGTSYDVLRGIVVGVRVCRRRPIRLVHARGYVPSVMASCLKRLCKVKFLFDMRGFWADEKVEGGHWRRSSLAYRLAKRWERRFFEGADGIVSLTAAGVRAFPSLGYRISPQTPLAVIPTCTDLTRFSPGPKDSVLMERLGVRHHTVVGCVGTLSSWYLRTETLRYLAMLVHALPQAKMLFVTREDHERLRRDAVAAGIPSGLLVITEADFQEMPAYVRLMDVGVFFIKVCFSKQASAATKLAEFLATGIPVVINDGIGDSGAIVRNHNVGVVLPDVTDASFARSVDHLSRLLLEPSVRTRCRAVAQRYFDLRDGVATYLELYRRLDSAASRATGVGVAHERTPFAPISEESQEPAGAGIPQPSVQESG